MVKTKKEIGRPKMEFDWTKLDAVMQFGANQVECAEVMGCHIETIAVRIKEKHGVSFPEYKEQKMGKLRVNLRRKQYETAMAGNITMLIWLGKQWLGQSDKQEIAQTNKEIVIKIDGQDSRL